jgi:hypothetical protein
LQSGAVNEDTIEAIDKNKRADLIDGLPIDAATKTAIKDRITAFNSAVSRIQQVAPQIDKLNSINNLNSSTERSFGLSATTERLQAMLSGPLNAYRDTVLGLNAQKGYSLNNEISNIRTSQGLEQIRVLQSLPFKLTGQQLETFNQAVEGSTARQIAQAQALDAVNTAVSNFTTRVALAEKSSAILSSAYKNLAADALKGGTSLKDVIQTFTESVSSDFIDLFLEYAMKPMEDQLRGTFNKLFRVEDAQKEAARQLSGSATALTTSATTSSDALKSAATTSADALKSAAAALQSGSTTPLPEAVPGVTPPPQSASTIDPSVSHSRRLYDIYGRPLQAPQQPATTSTRGQSEFEFMSDLAARGPEWRAEVENALEQSFAGIGESLTQLGKVADTTGKQTGDAAKSGEQGFGKFLGAMTGVATGALAITGAIQAMQDSEGGTYGTLMGIAGVLGGLGSIFGGISSLGKRAAGGPVSARRPYIVGEIGPELFVPEGNGTIIPNDKIAFTGRSGAGSSTEGGSISNAFSTLYGAAIPFTKSTERAMAERSERETVSAINNPKPLDIRFESQVINGVEYVTAEQHQRGMAQAAERGRALTLEALQNSVTSRRKVGIN